MVLEPPPHFWMNNIDHKPRCDVIVVTLWSDLDTHKTLKSIVMQKTSDDGFHLALICKSMTGTYQETSVR